MKQNQILKDAIAEAKIIKETAIANAKAALEEQFEPRLRNLLSKKIEEMENLDPEVGEEEYEEYLNLEEGEEDNILEEIEDDLAKEEEDEEEFDIHKYEGHICEEDEEETNVEEEETDTETEDTETDTDTEDTETEEFNIEDMSEEDLISLIEDVISDMMGDGEIESTDDEIDLEIEDDETGDDEEIDLEIEDDEAELEEIQNTRLSFNRRPLQRRLNEEKEKQLIKEVNKLKSDLKEINLLNSKLLYLNKLFRKFTLNESQKTKAVKLLDKVKNLTEAKMVFETLSESLIISNTKKPLKENLSRASKPVGRNINQNNTAILPPQFERWQKLAGLEEENN